MNNLTQRRVLGLLYLIETPTTQEHLTTMALRIGLLDTPQSLRSRMVELERAGYTHRVDRAGLSTRKRPCWRWQLTKKGEEVVQELLDSDTSNERD